jgi:DNA invertase Pin-like site-specific DNA recombinase
MTISAVIYARMSADCPTSVEQQIDCLRAVADNQSWTVSRTFADRPTPPKRGRQRRPGETALLENVRAGAVQKVLLFSIDRVGRTLAELVGFLETCRTSKVDIYIHDRQIDTAACNGLSLFDIASMLSHHILQGRRDRILLGQAAARNANIRFGRPPLSSATTEKVKRMLATGKGVRETARLARGVSAATVCRIKASMNTIVAS